MAGARDAVTFAAPAALRWLEGSGPIRLLNCFEDVVNLSDAANTVVSLVRSESRLGPFAAVFPTLYAEQWASDAPCRADLPSLDASVAAWNPRPNWIELRKTRDWLALALPLPEPTQLVAELATALAQADGSRAAAVTARLAGAGPGLTPEGDDVLVGAMLAVWATRDEVAAASLCAPIVAVAVARTTLLSAAWLQAAARGEAAAPWHALISALSAARGTGSLGLAAAWQGVLAMGETSGVAALSGFATTLARSRG